jgi:hypothetical protein
LWASEELKNARRDSGMLYKENPDTKEKVLDPEVAELKV